MSPQIEAHALDPPDCTVLFADSDFRWIKQTAGSGLFFRTTYKKMECAKVLFLDSLAKFL